MSSYLTAKVRELESKGFGRQYIEGYLSGYIHGCSKSKKIYFPSYLPKELDNNTYTETKYGENQENVWTEYVTICEGEDDYCSYDIGVLLENIKDAVNCNLDPETPSTSKITEKEALEYLQRVKQINCIKKELVNFAIHLMKLRHKSVALLETRSASGECKLSRTVRTDVRKFNHTIENVDKYYKHKSGVRIDEESLRFEW